MTWGDRLLQVEGIWEIQSITGSQVEIARLFCDSCFLLIRARDGKIGCSTGELDDEILSYLELVSPSGSSEQLSLMLYQRSAEQHVKVLDHRD